MAWPYLLTRDGRLLVEPGARFFELRAEGEDGAFFPVAPRELTREGESRGRAAEGQHQRRLTREVEQDGKGREGEDAAPVLVHVLQHHVDPAELRRQRPEPRRQQDVVALVEGSHLPSELVGG